MEFLIKPLKEIPEYCNILDSVKNGRTPVGVTGVSESQKAHLVYAVCSHLGLKGMYVTFNELQARKIHEDFSFFLGDDVLLFPSREIMMHDVEARSHDSIFQRLRVLDRMIEGRFGLVVVSAEALSQILASSAVFKQNTLNFTQGQRIKLDELSRKLVEMGYERVVTVEGPGQFSVRGGIVDLFSVNIEHPVRIELFDDEIDSLRIFDELTQRSMEKLDTARFIPAREIICPEERLRKIVGQISRDAGEHIKKIEKKAPPGYVERFRQRIKSDIERLENGGYFPGIDRYIHYLLDNASEITDYLDKDALIFIDEPGRLRQRVDNVILEHYETCKSLIEKGAMLPESQKVFHDFDTLRKGLEGKRNICLSSISVRNEDFNIKHSFSIASRLTGSYQGHINLLTEDIAGWKRKNYRIVILSGTRGKGERLSEELRSKGIESAFYDKFPDSLRPGEIVIVRGSLNRGFEYLSAGFVVVSDREMFSQGRKYRKTKAKISGDRINLFTDLNTGDYVVHRAHGIGQYVGVENLEVEGVKRDYLKIRYTDGDYLYIPTNQMDLIQKYIGSEGKLPRLNKLGGADWAKTKKKVKESLKEIAEELIRLYAQRQSLKGFAFSKDTVWQRQLEELFTYEETDDQLKCIEEIKQDMESERPMDRLLCGDVGYGKTEVAIRAVFKAVMDGKQVAYLVPTTILAQQHYNTFKERMADFPVAVEVLSRFRSAAEQKRILKDVRLGNIDVLIGTHRLLQKDIHFKDLGLLVVDEEQRFGVSHKERLKNIKPNVDVLTLTATPIPRTLHMSLVGIRDISVIEDPPEERYPVQTYVMEYDKDVVRDAIIRELGRKGQVFYLYNRVRSIDIKALEISESVPEARVAVAHGQMDEKRLEDIMMGFINGEFDILVCTTIIESGLDMPNVNTIIVEDADRMGLSQLYQLRGRVGRSNRLAYAYITYKKDKILSEVAEKRLQAIRDFTELGSGFKIAMRDMEIRGAGNLLGAEQHGHMEAVGYDMYCRLLDEAVRELKGEETTAAEIETTVDLNVSAYIDSEYIAVESQKIEMYKKIASIQDEESASDIEDELVDRYGDLPQPVGNLINIAHIKALAKNAGFSSVSEKNGHVVFQFAEGIQVNIGAIGKLAAKYRRRLLFNAGSSPYLMYKTEGMKREKLLDNIKILLQEIKSFEDA